MRKRSTLRNWHGVAHHDPVLRAAADRGRAYHQLSVRYAREGDVFAAVHAAWAADLCAAKAVVWERAVAGSAPPTEAFTGTLAAVCDELSRPGPDERGARDAAGAVRTVRRALGTAVDRRTQQRLAASFRSLDYLAGLAVPDGAAGAAGAAARLRGMHPGELSQIRRRHARDCMAVAVALQRGGRDADAARLIWQSDWAAFEAYLLDAALATGDEHLVTVALRWAVAGHLAAALPGLPDDLTAATDAIRATLCAALDPVEAERLRDYFEPAP